MVRNVGQGPAVAGTFELVFEGHDGPLHAVRWEAPLFAVGAHRAILPPVGPGGRLMTIPEMLAAVRAIRLSGGYRNSLGDGLTVSEELDDLAQRVEAIKQAGTITRKTEGQHIGDELKRLTLEVRASEVS